MAYTTAQAKRRLEVLGHARTTVVRSEAARPPADNIPGALILAVGLRETGIQNITGDGGHGRGWLQIDDRFHGPFLAAHAGCRSGSWDFTFSRREGGARPAGRCPGMLAAQRYATGLILASEAFAVSHGVPHVHAGRFAIAAFNCGAGNALRAFEAGGIANIDRFTTGQDYSADVLANVKAVRAALRQLHW